MKHLQEIRQFMISGFKKPNAAVGQSGLQALYEAMFRNYGILVGQVVDDIYWLIGIKFVQNLACIILDYKQAVINFVKPMHITCMYFLNTFLYSKGACYKTGFLP